MNTFLKLGLMCCTAIQLLIPPDIEARVGRKGEKYSLISINILFPVTLCPVSQRSEPILHIHCSPLYRRRQHQSNSTHRDRPTHQCNINNARRPARTHRAQRMCYQQSSISCQLTGRAGGHIIQQLSQPVLEGLPKGRRGEARRKFPHLPFLLR